QSKAGPDNPKTGLGREALGGLRLVARVMEIMKDTLAGGEDVLISGFGKFEVRRKHPRQGRNPQTGDSLTLRQRQVVVFRISSTLRRKLNPKPADPERPWAVPDAAECWTK
ncbi:MAG: hypothetical protein FJ135_17655, partial [Deltaproteobacteria bacterium]|nr:hypothetical protein [Deltaproteobacteria bacterium]